MRIAGGFTQLARVGFLLAGAGAAHFLESMTIPALAAAPDAQFMMQIAYKGAEACLLLAAGWEFLQPRRGNRHPNRHANRLRIG